MRPLPFRLLVSAAVAGSLIAGRAAFAQHPGYAGGHAGFAGHAAGIPSRGFIGPIAHSPGQITTLAPHAIATPGRAVFPASSRAFVVPGVAPQSRPAFQPPWRDRGGWRYGGGRDHDHDHDRGRGRGYWRGSYGFPGGYPLYANAWELLPYDTGDSDFSPDSAEDSAVQQGTAQDNVPAPPPDTGYRPEYPGVESESYPQQSAAAPPPAEPIAPEPELTLIFKDGHTQAIHNYVLTSSDLVILDQAATGRQRRIPLDQIDLPATEKAAQQAGLDFTPPA